MLDTEICFTMRHIFTTASVMGTSTLPSTMIDNNNLARALNEILLNSCMVKFGQMVCRNEGERKNLRK
jgi:hypothetical protein